MRLPLALLLLPLAACRAPARAAPDAGSSPALQVEVADAGWALTEGRLAAWLAYQAALQAQPAMGRGDGGPAFLRDEVRRRARLELALRADAGLCDDDIDRIEDLVTAVAAQRNLARITGAEAVREFERASADLKDQQRTQVEAAIKELRARSQPGATLAEEKARFGEESVRVLLTREAEVIRTWDALMEGRGDKR